MTEKTFSITSESGLHARPVTKIIEVASKFKSDIKIEFNGKKADLKSILGVLSLAIGQGSIIKIEANGTDEKEAIETIGKTFREEGIGE